jgi:phospholipid transport system transporter-binding protein
MESWRLTGVLDLSSIPELWTEMEKRIRGNSQLTVDLSGVESTSSAALALLLQGLEEAQKSGCDLGFKHIPTSLLALAKVSNVENLLLQPGSGLPQ